MPGPLPKETRQRERDTKRRSSEFVTVTRDGVLRGPTLAKATGDSSWSPQVRSWWDTWRRSPQAVLFEDTDWGRLALMVPIVEAYFRRPSAAALSEIRMNEERLGATYADRLRSRIRVTDPETGEVVPLRPVGASARERFGGGR